MRRIILCLCLLPLLGGCVATAIASTAVGVVTLPVKAAAKGVDMVTTSQSEADRKRGKELRKQQERDAKAAKKQQEEDRKRAMKAQSPQT